MLKAAVNQLMNFDAEDQGALLEVVESFFLPYSSQESDEDDLDLDPEEESSRREYNNLR